MVKTNGYKLIILAVIILAGLGLYFATGLNQISPEEFKEWLAGFGVFSGLIFILVYSIAPVFLIPGSLLSISAGIIFGPLIGTLVVIIGASIGATLAFMTARYFGGSIQKKLEKVKFMHIGEMDRKMEKQGFLITFLLRLIPIFPYNGLNYFLGLTKVRTRDYIAATVIGMIPGTYLYVYLGSSIFSLNPATIGVLLFLFVLVIGAPAMLKGRLKKHIRR